MKTGFDLIRAAIDADGVTANERSVLMVLAVMANADAQAWPPISGETGLTTKTVLSERAVQRAIQRLVALGHLTRKQLRNGVVYTVHPASRGDCETGATQTGDGVTPATEAPRGDCEAPKQPVTTIPTKASPSSVKREGKRGTRVPGNFVPVVSPGSITAKAMAAWPPGELEAQIEHFVDHHTAKGTLFLDWQAAWRTWVKQGKRFNGQRQRGTRDSGGGEGFRDPLYRRVAEGRDPVLDQAGRPR